MIIQSPVRRFTVYGNSMLPTLKPGQDILVWCWFLRLQVGDLVVFRKDIKDMVKRVEKIRHSEIFCQGDNEKESTDSRHFGWIKRKEIIGKVIFYS